MVCRDVWGLDESDYARSLAADTQALFLIFPCIRSTNFPWMCYGIGFRDLARAPIRIQAGGLRRLN